MRQEAITHPEECHIPPALIHRSELMLTRLKGIHQQNWLNPIDTTDFNRFPFNNFTYCLTLFPKCFSSFPHGTCSLSVFHQYLALDGVYHPFCATLPSNATRRKRITEHWWSCQVRDCHPLWYPIPRDLDTVQHGKRFCRLQLGRPEDARFQIWALPGSLAVTKGILVSFFSSAYWYA